MTSGGQGAPHFKRYGHELVSKPAISLKKCWGGDATVVKTFFKQGLGSLTRVPPPPSPPPFFL